MKKPFQNQHFLTAGVHTRIPLLLQLTMWLMTDEMNEADYLQIFELQKTPEGTLIVHKQEVPPYEHALLLRNFNMLEHNEKVYIIDDETHSTMLLAEEY